MEGMRTDLSLQDILTMWCVSCGVQMKKAGDWQDDKAKYQCPSCGTMFAVGMRGAIVNPEYRLFDGEKK